MNNRAFTLIEVLAVIVIVSLGAAIGGIGLASGAEHAQVQAAVAAWKDLDAQGRLLAQASGAVAMRTDIEDSLITLNSVRSGEHLAGLALPHGWLGTMLVDNKAVDSVIFDAHGRSDDYRIQMRSSIDSSRSIMQWNMCGLTGWIVNDEASP